MLLSSYITISPQYCNTFIAISIMSGLSQVRKLAWKKFFKVREKSGNYKVLDAKSGKFGIMLEERFHVTMNSSHTQSQKDG